jgi:cytochrome c biogenesis protein CcdA
VDAINPKSNQMKTALLVVFLAILGFIVVATPMGVGFVFLIALVLLYVAFEVAILVVAAIVLWPLL